MAIFFGKRFNVGRGGIVYRSAVGQFQGSVLNGLTAKAGGGQTGATALTAMMNRVTTVATAGDSGLLTAALAGLEVVVVNDAAINSMNIFPATGDKINQLAANTAIALAANKTISFYCVVAGTWHSQLTA